MIPRMLNSNRSNLFSDKPCQTFMQAKAQDANAFLSESECRSQHEVGSIRFQ
jgi:hypothetical protein